MMLFFEWLAHNSVRPVFWIQPVFYSAHGWLATEMALWLLFHPYEPKFIPLTPIQIPFTPGIFPRGRHKLSISIANTITDILLTESDIKKQAQKLITEDNILKTIDALFDSVGLEMRDINHIRRIYRYVDQFIPPLLEKWVGDYISGLETGDGAQFKTLCDQFFRQIMPRIALNEEQAGFLAKAVETYILTPKAVRNALIQVLTPEAITLLENTIRNNVSGLQSFLIRFVDVQKGFVQLRQYLIDEPQASETIIADMLTQIQLHKKLTGVFTRFSPQQMPAETLEQMKGDISDALKNILIAHRQDIIQALSNLGEGATHSLTNTLLHTDYNQFSERWMPTFKRDLAHFAYTYLDKQLESMVSKALPIISLNTVIIDKIDQFSAKELEETIQRICHRELRWLAFLGTFLGFWLGLISNITSYWWHPTF